MPTLDKKFTNQTLVELVSSEADRKTLAALLSGKRVKDKVEEKRVAELLVQRAIAGIDIESFHSSPDQDLISHALMFAGLNTSGQQKISDTLANDAFEQIMPLALGESEKAPLFNSDVNEVLVAYLIDKEKVGLSALAMENVDSIMTPERKAYVLQRAYDGRLDTEFEPEVISQAADSHDVTVETAPKTVPDESPEKSPSELTTENSEPVAKLGTHASQPDIAELQAQADAVSVKYRLDMDAQLEAQLKLHAIMEANPSWAERSLWTKANASIKNNASAGYRALTGQTNLTYPGESLLGSSLSEVDASGRVVGEMFKFTETPFSFKVKFSSPKTSDVAYEAAALKIRSKGISKPYIKASFRNPDEMQLFLKKSVKSLVDAGYDIDDIKVQKHMEPFFEQIKLDEYPNYSIEEAPEPDDWDPKNNEDLDPDHAAHLEREKDLVKNKQDVLNAEKLTAEIMAINGPLENLAAQLYDEQNPSEIKDLNAADIISVLERVPNLRHGEDAWNLAVREPGVSPNTRQVVVDTIAYIDKLVDLADPNIESKRAIGSKELPLLSEVHEAFITAMPEKSERVIAALTHASNLAQPENSDAQQNVQQNESNDEYANAMRKQQEWEQSQQNTQSHSEDQGMPDYPDMHGHPEDGFVPSDEEMYQEMDPALQAHMDAASQGMGYDQQEGVGNTNQTAPTEPASPPQEEFIEPDNNLSFDLSDPKWAVISKVDFHELPESTIREIMDMTVNDEKIIDAMDHNAMPAGDLEVFKNTVFTVRAVFDKERQDLTNVGDKELELLQGAPEDLIPEKVREQVAVSVKEAERIASLDDVGDIEPEVQDTNNEVETARPSRR